MINKYKKTRLRFGKTQSQFGKMFSPPADKSIVSRWESGKSIPSAPRMKTFYKLLQPPYPMARRTGLCMKSTDYIDRSLDDLREAYARITNECHNSKFLSDERLQENMQLLEKINETTPRVKKLLELSNRGFHGKKW